MIRFHFAPALRWPWPADRKPLVVEHVRYTKKPAPDYRGTARALALSIGRPDLAEKLSAHRDIGKGVSR